MRIVARFDPPDALERLDLWKAEHARTLSALPDDAIIYEIGRATPKGTFVRVKVTADHAEVFKSRRVPMVVWWRLHRIKFRLHRTLHVHGVIRNPRIGYFGCPVCDADDADPPLVTVSPTRKISAPDKRADPRSTAPWLKKRDSRACAPSDALCEVMPTR